jgi:hypothetical protein
VRFWIAVVTAAALLAGCGLEVQEADLFLVTRTGPGPKLTLLVNSDGSISCNGGKSKQLSDSQLITARDLADSLDTDTNLRYRPNAHTVFTYTVKVPNGTFTFPDTAGSARKELAQLELFVIQAAADPCGISA